MSSTAVRAIILVFVCGPLFGFADVPNRSIDVVPHWKKGERLSLEITRVRERVVDGKSTVTGKTYTPFTLEVLSAADDGYLVGWTLGETKFEKDVSAEESFLRQVVDIMKGHQIVLQIDPHGTIIAVRNWKQLKDAALKTMDTILSATTDTPKGKVDPTLIAKLRAQSASMLATKDQVERLCTREAKLYFMVLGRHYALNEPLGYKDVLPNPLGGEAFPTQATFVMKSYDHKSEQAVIAWRQMTDPKETARIREAMVKEMTSRLAGKKPPQGAFSDAIAMEDRAEMLVDVAAGWVNTLSHARSLTIGHRAQVDTTSIVRRVP